jgi:hypothetical protein
MLRILGSPRKLCDGVTRRDLLHVGGLGTLGLTLGDFWRLREASAATSAGEAGKSASSFGKAKACILLFPYGSPPQHETFDPKPQAPVEIQGEMKAIATRVPGLAICDHLPRIAQVMDRVTVVRSMTHPYPVHGVAYAVTGMPTYTPDIEARPRDPQHWPFIGSIVDYLGERRARASAADNQPGDESQPPVPRNIGLPWLLNSKTDLDVSAGPYAAFLGPAYDPVWTDFDGRGTHTVPKYSEGQRKEFHDPFGGTTAEGRFLLSALGQSAEQAPLERLNLRRSLLAQFDRERLRHEPAGRADALEKFQQLAFSLLTSGKMREALDIGREPMEIRERYGLTLFGQACLAARRLVEAGGKFITIFWDGYGQFSGCAWDTHAYHYPRLKEYLLPGFDLAYSALIEDLDVRGLLDETLVLWMSEHGRTPQIDSKPKGAGRHHWSRVYSVALAGGGVARGKVVGSSDRIGGDVHTTPVSPKDILASAFHLLGIDPHTTVPDRLSRPLPVAGDGVVREELW